MARSEQEVLDRYLGRPTAPPEGYEGVHESTLHAALRDCRRAQNRDEWTGHLDPGCEADHFLGAVGYLCLIDQVSSAVGLRGGTYEADGLKTPYRALYDFTDLPVDVIEAMYGLRCSLAHDYSLVNKTRANQSASTSTSSSGERSSSGCPIQRTVGTAHGSMSRRLDKRRGSTCGASAISPRAS